MLHIHFGTGRLGLGLAAPFFRKPDSELILLSRAQAGKNETGETVLTPERKAQLLSEQPQRIYGIQTPGEPAGLREVVTYTDFQTYESNLDELIPEIIRQSKGKGEGVVVTASVVNVSNYSPVVKVLNQICEATHATCAWLG